MREKESEKMTTEYVELGKDLQRMIQGKVISAADAGYDEARQVWNAMIDRRPALIARCDHADDIPPTIEFARRHRLEISVRGAGHNIAGNALCDGGLTIDFSNMKKVQVDAQKKRAYVEPGATLADLDEATQAHGLATPVGINSTTGIAGLTLGGGFGWLTRKYGMTIDNLVSVDMVTAEGKKLRASASENPDLFWAIRGGGGNFGVVTSFDFSLHPMQREVIGGFIIFPLEQSKQVLRFYSEYAATAPDDLYLSCGVQAGPEGTGAGFTICYSGPANRWDGIARTLRSVGTPIVDDVRAMDYVALQKSGDITESRALGLYTKTGFIPSLPPALIDAIVDGFEAHPERGTSMGFQHSGGAIARVAGDATAFPHRQIIATMLLNAQWDSAVNQGPHIDWLRQYWRSLEPHTRGFYTNDAIEESQQQIDDNYAANLPRLVALKNRYDSTNLFRLNANIVPTV
jgi:FAD/FMN-containing dehydrogenase